MGVRADFIYTYWVLAWYVAYMFKITQYNPKLALAIGMAINIGVAIAVFLKGGPLISVIRFLIVNLLLKGIPLYTIYKTKTTMKDIYAIVGLFAIYTLWLYINGTTPIKENIKVFRAILLDKKETPIIKLLSKII